MLEMIEERAQSNNKDLFTSLIAAYETDNEKMKLNNEELMGNIFAFLVGEWV